MLQSNKKIIKNTWPLIIAFTDTTKGIFLEGYYSH